MVEADDPDVLIASIAELVDTFREALVSLVPSAHRANLPWKGLGAHPSWERLAAAAFDAFVHDPIFTDRDSSVSDAKLASYDIDYSSYPDLSWISISDGIAREVAFVRFVTVELPFDSVEGVEIEPTTGRTGERTLLNWPLQSVSLMRRPASSESPERVFSIVAEE